MADEATVASAPAAEPAVSDAVASYEVKVPLLTFVQPPTTTEPTPVETTQTNGETEDKKEDKPAETAQTNGDKEPESDKPADEPAKSDEVEDVSAVMHELASRRVMHEAHLAVSRRTRLRVCLLTSI